MRRRLEWPGSIWRTLVLMLMAVVSTIAGCGDDDTNRARTGDGFREKPPSWQFEFDLFLEREGIPVYQGFDAGPVDQLILEPWARLGGKGAYLRLHGHQGLVSTYVQELAPGEKSKVERHVYDEILYVFSGSGVVRIWRPEHLSDARSPDLAPGAGGVGGTMVRRDVQAGSLLAPPLNAFHEIENVGPEPMRIIGFTNAPPVIDLYRNDAFVFDNDFVFDERWAEFEVGSGGDEDEVFWPAPPAGTERPRGNSNDPFLADFVPDVTKLGPVMHRWNDKDADFASFWMAGSALSPHVSRWDAESYQTAHRHNGGATVLLLAGEGYYLMWPSIAGTQPYRDGFGDTVVRGDFVPGSLYSPPDDWYHLHFNSGATQAVYLAVTPQGRQRRLGYVPRLDHSPIVTEIERGVADDSPIRIRRKDEDPRIERDFERAVREREESAKSSPAG